MDSSEFDALVDDTLGSWHCPGVAMAVLRGDEVTYQRAAGWAQVAGAVAVTADTRFALGSVTKPLTAMSAALLVDERKLDWDRPVCEDLPEFILHDLYASRHVTLRDMLSHRTGLPRHDYAAWRLDLSRAELVRRMRHLEPSASFRERFQYNNLMYAAAAHLVEKVAGQRWEDLVRERIFGPLGMGDSNFEPALADRPLAHGYRAERDDAGAFRELVELPFGAHTEISPGAAGALFSTLADMVQWLRVHLNDGKCGNVQLLSRPNLKQMHAPQMVIPVHEMGTQLSGLSMQSYGLGWFIRPYPYAAATLLFHDGNVEGYSAHVCFVPEHKIGVVVLANGAVSPVTTILAREAIDRVLGLEPKDWNGRFHAMHDRFNAADGKGRQASAARQQQPAPATLPLADYQGRYAAAGYPDFGVRLVDGALQGCTVGSHPWSPLRHLGHDLFEWHVTAWDSRWRARFALDEQGEVASVTLPLSGDKQEISFRRKPLVLDAALLAQLAGRYAGEIAGLHFHAEHRDGKLFWTEEGMAAEQVLARRATADEVEFAMGRCRIVFTREGGGWNRAQLRTPSAVYEARRVDLRAA